MFTQHKKEMLICAFNLKLLHIKVSSPCDNRKLTAPLSSVYLMNSGINRYDIEMNFLFENFQTPLLRGQGAVSIRKTVLPGMAIPMLKIRRPNGRLISNMEITIRR